MLYTFFRYVIVFRDYRSEMPLVGFIGLDGMLNQAITIRTFVSRNHELWFQAGGGIVAASQEENELQEINNKLGALRNAILMAEQMSSGEKTL